MRFIFSIGVGAAAWLGMAQGPVVESARAIPVAAEVDVLVVGGTAAGVSAATAAAEAGARVFLAGGAPYIGEDVAGTLELACENGTTPLERRLAKAGSSLAGYSYDPQPGWRPFGGWQYFNDPHGKFSTTAFPSSPWDSVLYTNRISIYCTLHDMETIASVEVLALENDNPNADASISVDHRGRIPHGTRGPLTGKVTATLLDGPRKGSTIALVRSPRTTPVLGIVIRDVDCPTQHASEFTAELNCKVHKVRIDAEQADGAICHLLSRIRFRRPATTSFMEDPTPLAVKRTLDRVLIDSGVRFLTCSPATDILVDGDGQTAGAVIANRSGRQAVLAKSVVDATRLSGLARTGSPAVKVPGGKASFTMVASLPVAPCAFRCEPIGRPRFVDHSAHPTAQLYRVALELPLHDWTYPSLAAAETAARNAFFDPEMFDIADLIRPAELPPSPSRRFLRAVPDAGTLGERITAGAAAGREAAAEAKRRASPRNVRVEAKAADFKGGADVREFLGGLRPYEGGKPRTVASPSRELPVLGEYDVVVVGGGTSGTPAGISAGRAGAKTLIIEAIHMLGGVGTDGQIGGFYDTHRVGFQNEFTNACARSSVRNGMYMRADVLWRFAREAHADVWFGAFGIGALVEGCQVKGVVVATPLGRGVVRAKAVIDGTGNSDIAAAAGAETVFVGAHELALQSAGQSPHRLNGRGMNSDFGFLNDSDAVDLWLFGVRSRAGAPDAWDLQRMVNSRERRRIVSDYAVQAWDLISDRRFPDTMTRARSKQDGHGYFTDEFGCVGPQDGSREHFVNVPLRSYLPKGLSGIAVVGLGKGVARDVVPFVRMKASLMNEGYALGLVAAEAAKSTGGDLRKVDVKGIQAKLVEKGSLSREVLSWTDDSNDVTDKELASAVATLPDGYHGSEVVMREKARARPLLVAAYRNAESPAARQVYAMVLGLLGDAIGAETLAEIVSGRREFIKIREWGKYSFGRNMEPIGVAVALARGRSALALEPLRGLIERISAASSINEVRIATLAAEAYASPKLAPALADALKRPGLAGWARTKPEELSPLGGYGIGPEVDRCLRELALARSLLACGDHEGLARKTFEAYAKDPRGAYAEHANAVLRNLKR